MLYALTVTVVYSDTFPVARGCHCNRLALYSHMLLGEPPPPLLPPVADVICERSPPRSVFTSGGQYFVALNTTVVLWSVVSLIAGLVTLMTLISVADKKQQACQMRASARLRDSMS